MPDDNGSESRELVRLASDRRGRVTALQVNGLGAFEVWFGGIRGAVPSRTKAKALLCYLALQRGAPVSRERLVEIFWRDADPRAGRANLNTALWDVRRALRKTSAEAEAQLSTTTSVAQLSGDVVTDVARFVSLASSGKLEMLREGLALYRGDFMEGDFCEWSVAQRENLAGIYEDIQARLLWSSRDPSLARDLIARNPYHEEAYTILIEHELQASRFGAARDVAARAKAAMSEVDVIPGGALSRALRAATAGSDAPRKTRSQIPVLLTTYVGRESELAETVQALSQSRLLTLTGPGGVGKTRLSIRLAQEVEARFADGLWLVDLAQITDPALVPRALCEALSVFEDPSQTYEQRLVGYLAERSALLILDNCEHLTIACSALVSSLLTQCPNVKIVVTSRVRLNLSGENVYRVPPLSPPDAVTLFIDRARSVDRSFATGSSEPLGAVCKRLDYLPFAIELAAARISIMTLEQLLSEIDSHFEVLAETRHTSELGHHKNLVGMVDWSVALLPEEEKSALESCAVFPSDFSIDAFSGICAPPGTNAARGFEVLLSLTDKSLVLPEPRTGEKRYRLLETTKQFVQDRLLQAGLDASARTRHAQYFLTYLQHTHRDLADSDVEAYMRNIRVETDNIRAAMTWMLRENENPQGAVACIGALMQHWRESADFAEGLSWIEGVLAQCELDDVTRAWLHICGALLATGLGDLKRLKAGVEFATPVLSKIDDPQTRAVFCYTRALSLLQSAEYTEAERSLAMSLEAARRTGSHLLAASALNVMANTALHHRADPGRSRSLYEEALSIARSIHATKRSATILLNLGMMFEAGRDIAAAIAVTQEAIDICDELPSQPLHEGALVQLATYEDQRGDFMAMRARLREAFEFMRGKRELRDRVAFVILLEGFVTVAERGGQIDEAGLLLGFCAAFREQYEIGAALAGFGASYEAAVERMRRDGGDRAVEALVARGRLLSKGQTFAILARL